MKIRFKNIFTHFIILQGSLLFLSSCFKEDERIFPLPPGDATVFTFEKSIYDFHSYFDFSTDSVKAFSLNDSWQIEFGCLPESWDIRVNSSAYYQVFDTGDTSFNGIVSVTDPAKYIFDASGGNPDSSAFSTWIDRTASPYVPTNRVFLVGQYDGLRVKPLWKIRIESVTDTSYQFTYAGFPSGVPVSVTLGKDGSVNYLQYNLSDQSIVRNEPPSGAYDLLFTQYGTILYDDNGVPTPYFVRGILLNPNQVQAALDTIHPFADITYDLIRDLQFSNRIDIIGHEWKDVKVDQAGNTAEYFVNTKLNWLVKDSEGFIYKMRFIEYYNSLAEAGYTTFEYQRL